MAAAAPGIPDRRRRALLRGRVDGGAPALRPPWALPETGFIDACTQCGDCIAACPERVLVAGDGGFPEFDPRRGECTFCGDCVASCKAGAFAPAAGAPWRLQAHIADGCLAVRGIVCSSCRDACGESAIRFPLTSRVPAPVVATERCTGCGACVSACPADAIALRTATAGEAIDA